MAVSTGAQFVYAEYGKAKIDNDLLKGDYKRNAISNKAILEVTAIKSLNAL